MAIKLKWKGETLWAYPKDSPNRVQKYNIYDDQGRYFITDNQHFVDEFIAEDQEGTDPLNREGCIGQLHTMRIEATEVLAQYDRNRAPIIDDSIGEPVGGAYGRATRLADIEAEAVEFANAFLLDFDLPSTPYMHVGNMKGFENLRKPFKQVVGVIVVNANFNTLSGHRIRLGLAIPVHKGEFQKPSIVYYQDKKRVFSQDLLNDIISSIETTRPKLKNEFTPNVEFQHIENIEKPLFSAPDDPTGWSLLITERY